jgi:hypothetical protein
MPHSYECRYIQRLPSKKYGTTLAHTLHLHKL